MVWPEACDRLSLGSWMSPGPLDHLLWPQACSLSSLPHHLLLSPSFRGFDLRIQFIVQSLSRIQPFCDPTDCSPPGSSVRGISQARVLEQIAISFARGSSRPRDRTHVSYTGRQVLYHWATMEAHLIQWPPRSPPVAAFIFLLLENSFIEINTQSTYNSPVYRWQFSTFSIFTDRGNHRTGLEHFQHLPGSFSHALFLPISSKHKPSSGFQYHRLVFAVSSLTVTKNIFSVFRWCFIWINDGKVFGNNPFTMHKTVNVTSIIIINYLYYYNYFHLLILLKSIFIRGK